MIAAVALQYAQRVPPPEARPSDRAFLAWYRSQLYEIGRACAALHISTAADLDGLFMNAYLPHTLRAGVVPKIIDFATFAGIPPAYLDINNANKNTAIYSYIIKWDTICRDYLIAQLMDEPGSNVNSIFILKSKYGIREDTGPQQQQPSRRPAKTRAEIIKELSSEGVFLPLQSQDDENVGK